MTHRKPFNIHTCLFGTAIACITTGIFLILLKSILHKAAVDNILTMTPDSKTFQAWSKTETPLEFDIYIFNWTNSDEFYNLSSKPKFEQLGPYKFHEYIDKVDVEFCRNDTMTFRRLKRWYFRPDVSNGTMDDAVTSINPVALSAAHKIRDWSYLLKKGLSVTLRSLQVKVEITRSVRQMLFEGYDEPVLQTAKGFNFLSTGPEMEKFGWFYGRNDSKTFDGLFNMGTGNSYTMGEIYRWNNWIHSPFYEEACSHVGGSAGEFFGQHLKRNFVTLFHSDVCRSVQLDYHEDVLVKDIEGYKYVIGDRFLDNGSLYPENRCFCTGECTPSGVVNVSSCKYGSPGFVSLPHFYKADESYLETLDGLNPDKDLHEFSMILEPRTGLPLKVQAKLQLNLLVQPNYGVALYEGIPKIFFPVLWFEQVVTISDSLAFQFKLLLNIPVICVSLGIILIIVGLILVAFVYFEICRFIATNRKGRHILKEQVPLNQEMTAIIRS